MLVADPIRMVSCAAAVTPPWGARTCSHARPRCVPLWTWFRRLGPSRGSPRKGPAPSARSTTVPGRAAEEKRTRPYRRCTGASAHRTRLLEQQACPEVEHPLERLGGIELARQVRPARPFQQVALRPLAVVDPGNEDAWALRPVGGEGSAARSDPAVREREQRLVCAFERRVEAVDGERPLGIRR